MGKNLIQQKRGKGSSTYTTPAHNFPGVAKIPPAGQGVVIDFVDSKVHTAALAVIRHDDGGLYLTIAPEQLRVGQPISFGAGSPAAIGNALPLSDIPEGTPIHLIEARPGDGGKFVRSSGSAARIFAKYGTKVTA